MGLFYERLRAIELERGPVRPAPRPGPVAGSREARAIRLRRWHPRPFQVVALSSNKGGVGKTTLAANLAVTLRALRPELPVLVLGLDDQSLLDRMFSLGGAEPAETVASGLRIGSFATAIRPGRHGVHYVPSDPFIGTLRNEISDVLALHETLDRTGFRGTVIVDTKSDLEILTRGALAASDLTLVPVRDNLSLLEGSRIFELLDRWALPRERARVLLSMIDARVPGHAQLDARLREELERRALPSLATCISASPKVQALGAGLDGRPQPVLEGAPQSRVQHQLQALAREVLTLLGPLADARTHPRLLRLAPPLPARRTQPLRGASWRKPHPDDEAAVAHLVGEIQTARAG